MEQLVADEARNVWVGEVSPSQAFLSPVRPLKFAVLLLNLREELSPGQMSEIAQSMIEQGCRYAVCAGHHCEDWESVFDAADLGVNPESEDEGLVMTTSHPDESLNEVAEFFFNCTSAADGTELKNFVVAILGGKTDLEEVKREIARAASGAA